MISRLNGSQTLTIGLILLHGASAGLALLRPDLVELVPGYAPMSDLMSTGGWGAWMGLTCLLLLGTRQGSVWRALAQLSSASLLCLLGVLVSLVYGPNFGTLAYAMPALGSLLLLKETAQVWFLRQCWYGRLQDRVARWVTRRRERRTRGGGKHV